MNRIVPVVATLLIFAFTAPARAQEARTLEISFNDGRVTLVAENVTLREILAEWARKGGSTIVNAEKVTGQPMQLTRFENQLETEVLRTLLREVPGYGASMRAVPEAGASAVEAVYIIATRTVGTPASSAMGSAAAVVQPVVTTETPSGFYGPPQAAPRLIQGSPDDELPPVRPVLDGPPMTPPNPAATNPNLRTGPGGVVTSTVPGVIIPVQGVPPGGRGAPPNPTGRGGGGRGGGRGGGGGGGGQR